MHTYNLSTHNLSTHDFITHNITQLTHRGWAWQVWNLWHWAGSGGALVSLWTPWTAQLLAWQGWHLRNWAGSAGALGSTSRGMRGTWRHRLPLLMAGVALVALGWVWWRAWFPVDAVVATAVGVPGVALGHINLHFVS